MWYIFLVHKTAQSYLLDQVPGTIFNFQVIFMFIIICYHEYEDLHSFSLMWTEHFTVSLWVTRNHRPALIETSVHVNIPIWIV